MNQVWESAPVTGNELLLLLALADNANDQAIAWPSIPTLARKTRTSERTVHRAIARLAAAGHITVTGKAGTANRYRINTARWATENPGQTDTPDNLSPLTPVAGDPGQTVTPDRTSPLTLVTGVPLTQLCQGRGDTAVSPEPPKNRQKNRHVCATPARDAAAPQPPGSTRTHPEADRIIDEWVTAHPAAKGQARRAVLAIVTTALADSIEPDLIAGGLARVADDGFLVTDRTLAVAIAQHAAHTARSTRDPVDPGTGIAPSRNAMILAQARRRAQAAEHAAGLDTRGGAP